MTVLNKADLKAKIVETVTRKQGCKAIDLCCEKELVLARVLDFVEAEPKLPDLIQELVDEGQLVEVEYVLPTLNFRAKSFLLPANSQVSIINKNQQT